MNVRRIKHNLYLKKEQLVGMVAYFFSPKKKIKIRIVSSKKWAYKVSEDILILNELRKRGIETKIVPYEDLEVEKEAIYLIKSIWGYQDNPKEFRIFLNRLELKKAIVINNLKIIQNNINKEEQYKLFLNYDIPHINSAFIAKDKDFLANVKKCLKQNFTGKIVVVKPSISASGNNTYILNGTNERSIELKDLETKFTFLNKKNKLIIQDFIPEVKDGEVSVICLNGKISYAVRRYPSVFTKENNIELIDSIDEKIKEITQSILNIKELKNAFYARIDFIKNDNSYIVMELEYTDPQLFLNVGCSKKETMKHVNNYCDELIAYLKKSKNN